MKLDGRDLDPNKKMSVSDQVSVFRNKIIVDEMIM